MKRNHFFYALPLPAEVKRELYEFVQNKELPFSRFVHQEDLHLTLAFLGAAEEDKLNASIELVAEAIQQIDPFPLSIHSLGWFGKKTSPRIFWAGVKEEEQLYTLQKKVYEACRQAGFELDRKPFRPHITVARKWKGEVPFELPADAFEKNFLTNSVVLYETHLDKLPKYKVKHQFEL
ncbi:RNA 2',3'-cyclic phosphodiesterase [Bacillus thermotolerans]|uniref:RNA 2',3'-cyclic phosphodiesterase n=1 Tax=Bacillus thermotolerans TaxID=1221996 RepID=A0A0F5IEE1_BACTR|nr:RNA 2',3'-cyclic phosphodiesterase [Bacillus thermotolerans]KKB43517.1 2'-5' RNA ligase [Bacillus thermotolerans]